MLPHIRRRKQHRQYFFFFREKKTFPHTYTYVRTILWTSFFCCCVIRKAVCRCFKSLVLITKGIKREASSICCTHMEHTFATKRQAFRFTINRYTPTHHLIAFNIFIILTTGINYDDVSESGKFSSSSMWLMILKWYFYSLNFSFIFTTLHSVLVQCSHIAHWSMLYQDLCNVLRWAQQSASATIHTLLYLCPVTISTCLWQMFADHLRGSLFSIAFMFSPPSGSFFVSLLLLNPSSVCWMAFKRDALEMQNVSG